MTRREFMHRAVVVGAATAAASDAPAAGEQASVPSFELLEITIAQLRRAMDSGEQTSKSVVEKYLERIEALDRKGPTLRHVLETNPEAIRLAEAADAERKQGKPLGALHGIPILIKDNIDTADRMTTTAGSLALEGSMATADAFIVRKLREAGAILLGKANLSEWANFRSTHSSSGWSGRGGQAKNPYALDRNPSGSSSGSAGAVAANCCAAAVGTETDGSIVSPAYCCSCVGIKPTVGLLSRAGIIPISKTQDTAGPIARTVEDAAILLGAMAGVDPRDEATAASEGHTHSDYTQYLKKDGLKGTRIGVARSEAFGLSPPSEKVLAHSVAALKDEGAEIIDPVAFPVLEKLENNELTVMLYEFKEGLNAYLAGLPPQIAVRSLEQLIEFNEKHADRSMPFFGQELFHKAQAKGALDSDEYKQSLAKCGEVAKAIDAAMDQHQLDALALITGGPPILIDLVNGDYSSGGSSTLAAVARYPSITVPAGYVHGLPVGLSFVGRAFSEPTLIRLAYAFEQVTKVRRAPNFLPTAELGN
jgi:amidase